MPRGDGTGPSGQGPRTGRGMGYCAGYPTPGFMNPGLGGRGRGLGRGMGWRRYAAPQYGPAQPMYFQPMSQTDEKKMLSDERKALEEEMKAIKTRLEELNK